MSTPLPQNRDHIQHLCERLALGICTARPTPVAGGFHHRMWQLQTDRGHYAVKQLSPDYDLGRRELIVHCNATEAIAEAFASRGIPAIFARRQGDEYLQLVDDTGYLVYPWTRATALENSSIRTRHALAVARIMAAMHAADLGAPDLVDTPPDVHSEENILTLVGCTRALHGELWQELDARLQRFVDIAGRQRESLALLRRRTVVSHGDLDHRNVLWDEGERPVLIDWESARRVNPTYEILLEALDWAEVTSHFDLSRFASMLSAYRSAGGTLEPGLLEAAFDCVLGDWVNWLMYNVGRSIDQQDRQLSALGAEQVRLCLVTVSRLDSMMEDLLRTAARQ